MQDSEKSVRKHTPPRRCEHCGNRTPMELIAIHKKVDSSDVIPVDPEVYEFMEIDQGRKWTILICPVCSGLVILQTPYTTEYFGESEREVDETEETQVLFPVRANGILENLPDNVEKEYLSALNVRNVDTNAFSVLLGRTLDAVCMDRQANGGTLYRRLESLAERGEIPQRLMEMAHQLRQLRNIGAHADLGDLPADVIPVLDALCKAILEYVYVAPSLIDQVSDRIEKLKRSEESADDDEADDNAPF